MNELEDLSFRPGRLREVRLRDLLIRFGFGAAVSAAAAVLSRLTSPLVGGVALAFPAILVASLTLIAEEDGLRQARNDARGALHGTFGLLGFGIVAAWLFPRTSPAPALAAATATWTVVALTSYGIARALGHGTDEPPGGRGRRTGTG